MARGSCQCPDNEFFDWVKTSSLGYLSPGTTDEVSTSSLTFPESEPKMKRLEDLYVDPTGSGLLSGFPPKWDSQWKLRNLA